jgi:Ulp1 family protease
LAKVFHRARRFWRAVKIKAKPFGIRFCCHAYVCGVSPLIDCDESHWFSIFSSEIIGSLELLRSLESFSWVIREELIWYLGFKSKFCRILHILDSLPNEPLAMQAGKQLQNILLQYFEDVTFQDRRITVHAAQVIPLISLLFFNLFNAIQVPLQPNTKDCGCFMIYFAKKFFENPDITMAIMKVV